MATGWRESLRQSGRVPAFLVHLAISAAVVFALGLAAWLVWYPQPYFEFDGGWWVMRLVIAVDVVLGPLLTLIVYRRGKKTLKLDLAVIALIQLAAFVYGAHILFQYRPAFLVYADQAFFSVNWPDIEKAGATRDLARIDAMRRARGPAMVVLELPRADGAHLREQALKGGPRIVLLGDYYQPLTPERWQAIAKETVQVLKVPDMKEDVEQFRSRFLEGSGRTMEQLVFHPAVLRYGILMLASERDSGALFGWMNE